MIIAFEGIDGAGKSTVCKKLEKDFPESFLFKYPVHVSYIDEIRHCKARIQMHKKMQKSKPHPSIQETINTLKIEIAFHFILDQLYGDIVLLDKIADLEDKFEKEWKRPCTSADIITFCDRTWISNIAYQDYHIADEAFKVVKGLIPLYLKPDVVIFMDIDPEEGIKRVIERKGSGEIDPEAVKYLSTVRTNYLNTIDTTLKDLEIPVYKIDSSKSEDFVHLEINNIIQSIITLERSKNNL